MVREYGSFPFTSFKLVFVDDLDVEVLPCASMALCSNRTLYPSQVIDPIYSSTRQLTIALASQWIGVNIIRKD